VAQQVISSIRTVAAFGGEPKEISRYYKFLLEAERAASKNAMFEGIGIGFMQFMMFCIYSLAFYYGNTLIPGDLSTGGVVNAFFAVIIGAFSLGQAGPHLASLGTAQGAAAKVFETIDRQSAIDSSSSKGQKPATVKGEFVFTDVSFHYPSRPDVPILKSFILTVKAGSTVALVGPSGSGKSTIVKLVERFYDPVAGKVTLDGVDTRDLNVAWMRQQIGFVTQEPNLFNTTIRQNILYGLPEAELDLPAAQLDARIREACERANAWNFIQKLPKALDTHVGESGHMMSGGQKQRIAIARAIISNPPILLLDEATSALDTTSERIVQSALDKASQGRTTLVIAHRLSTIKNADLIVVMAEGAMLEMGTHQELLDRQAMYASLVRNQELNAVTDLNASAATAKLLRDEEVVLMAEAPEAVGDEVVVPMPVDAAAAAVDTKESPHVAAGTIAKVYTPIKSQLSLKKPKAAKAEEDQPLDIMRVWKLNTPEWPYFIVGSIAAAANGVIMPLFSLIFSGILTDLGTDRANFWAILFLVLAVAAFIANLLQMGLFKFMGAKLTTRLRDQCFRAYLRQDIAFFDEEKHSTGALTVLLAQDASLVQGLSGSILGAGVQAISGLLAGLIIAFVHSWQVGGLLRLACFSALQVIPCFMSLRHSSLQSPASDDAGGAGHDPCDRGGRLHPDEVPRRLWRQDARGLCERRTDGGGSRGEHPHHRRAVQGGLLFPRVLQEDGGSPRHCRARGAHLLVWLCLLTGLLSLVLCPRFLLWQPPARVAAVQLARGADCHFLRHLLQHGHGAA
jgi:ABC-type multidrug transport system fused ATPase/permease subunit